MSWKRVTAGLAVVASVAAASTAAAGAEPGSHRHSTVEGEKVTLQISWQNCFGLIVDHFVYSGTGLEPTDHGFSAELSYDGTYSAIIPWSIFEDPNDLEALEARCTPL